jgi:hypothetical protein
MADSRHTVQGAKEVAAQRSKLFPKCCINIRKSVSNSVEVMRAIVPEDRAKGFQCNEELEKIFSGKQSPPKTKVLGISWDVVQDIMYIAAPKVE